MPRIPGLRPLIRLPDDERDLRRAVDDELSFHLDMLVDELVAAGHAPDAARREAERRFGDVERVRARCYETSTARETHMRRTDWFTSFGQDVVYALRGARRAPGFSLVVLLTLALGIGATTAMFSVVRGVLLRPLPFPEAERVVRLWPENPAAAVDHGQVSQTELRDWERDLRGFAAVAGFQALGNGLVYGDGVGEPIYAKTAFVSAGFFAALGTAPALGRALVPGEHVAGANRAVVVSHGFWQRQLGGEPSVIGRSIRLRDAGPAEAYTVVGVMPRDFAFPSPEVAVWMPESVMGPDAVGDGRQARWLDVVARLRPGVTPEQGRAELQGVLRGYAARFPDTNGGWTAAAVQDVRDSIVGPVRRGLIVLLGAVGLVLLVVCANVANLVLVRATTRARELALRTAIGAGRWRLLRLLLTESLLLALVGGALGVVTAWWGVRTLVALSGDFLPRAADVRLDGGVLAFAVGISVLTGIVFGLWPALRASNAGELAPALRENGRGTAGSRATHRARAALVTAEVALAVILVVGSGLMLRSFQRLTSVDPGFRPEHALLVRLDVDASGSSGALAERRQRIVERVRAVPGVLVAGASKNAPFTGEAGEAVPFTVAGQPAPPPGEEPRVLLQPASPGYLRALGVPLLAGEDISTTVGDSTTSPTAVISRGMAERFWRGRSPIGESFLLRNIPFRIIGVAGDVRGTRLDSLSGFTAYVPDAFMARVGMSLVVRTAGDPMALAAPLRAAIREVVPGQAFVEVVPLDAKLAAAASTARFFTVLVTVFGALALALAAIGLYGVVSYVVRLREREIGVRMALGAPPRRVLALVLRQGMTPVAMGLAIGLVGAFTATRVLGALLYEVSATDPLIFLGVAALLGAVAMVASYVPSRRASRVQPAITLRAE